MTADDGLLVVTALIFAFFLAEVLVLSIAEEGYLLRTYFWLDVVATASLIFDMVPSDHSVIYVAASDVDAVDTGYIARLGGRLGRTVRLVRLFRQLRLLKSITNTRGQARKKKETKVSPKQRFQDSEESSSRNQSEMDKLVHTVSEHNSLRVVLILLTSVVSMSLLQSPCADTSRSDSLLILSQTYSGTTRSFRQHSLNSTKFTLSLFYS